MGGNCFSSSSDRESDFNSPIKNPSNVDANSEHSFSSNAKKKNRYEPNSANNVSNNGTTTSSPVSAGRTKGQKPVSNLSHSQPAVGKNFSTTTF